MAYRARRSTRRSSGYRSTGYRAGRKTASRRTRRTVSRRGAASPQTLRIVIEGIPGSSVARPTMPAKQTKAKF